MAVVTEGKHTGEFLVSEANDNRGRETGVLILGQNLEAGTLVGKITASGKLTRHAPTAADGSEVVVGIIYDNVDATSADKNGTVFVTADSVVRESSLVYSVGATVGQITTANAELKTLGIVLDNR